MCWRVQLDNQDGLYPVLGETMISFIATKAQPFPYALCSKKDFWMIPAWKRAMVFVFCLRHMFHMDAMKPCRKFVELDFKFNSREFQRYVRLEKPMIESCKSYQDLPEEDPREGNRRTVKGSKRARPFNLSEVESESPVKRTYVIDDDSTSDEEAASAAAS